MAKEPKLNLGGPEPFDVVDPDQVPVLFGEVVTELRVVDGVVYVALGNIIQDGDAPTSTTVRVSARLRISRNAIQTIARALADPPAESRPEGQTLN